LRRRSRASAPAGDDHLQRDGGVEDEIVRAPDVAHPALADARDHPVTAGEDGARGELRGDGRRLDLVGGRVVVISEERLDFLSQRGDRRRRPRSTNAGRSAALRATASRKMSLGARVYGRHA
jgi:hypothetical protein